MRFLIPALAILLGACAVERGARLDPDPWRRPPATATQVKKDLLRALEQRDGRGVTRGMMQLSRMGATLSPATQARLAPLLDRSALPHDWRPAGPLAEAFAHNFSFNERNVEGSGLVAEIPADHRLIEGVAIDPVTGRLFAGSVVDRTLLVRDGGTWRPVPVSAPLGGIFGLAVDSKGRRLWAASAVAEVVPGPETAFSGLVAFDLDGLREARRVPTPGFQPGDVAVAEDGTVYASDPRSGAILRCRPGCAATEILVPPGILRSPQGLVAWPGGRRLYVADYELGLMAIDLGSLRIRPLVARKPVMLDGIDGLVRLGGKLVAIQNGTRPTRIVSIYLNRQGRIVEEVRVLEQGVAGEPTLGTMQGGDLFYVADAQWESYAPGGHLRAGSAQRPTPIRRVGADDIVLTASNPRGGRPYVR
ncbi:MAG: hypothetical protein QOJ91_150 [Sphingomonadales bacterium]|jgi:sugar lactone lactonase YvrE|nr:hypothetical protein [Sphingomonadales bacterium]